MTDLTSDSNNEDPPSPEQEETPGNRFLMADLCDALEEYLEPEQVKLVYDAYLFSAEAHEGQWRKSGEPYIYHPIAVARILVEMRMDTPSILAALLHDVLEDTAVTKAQLAERYGEHVAELVDGVSKLPKTEDQKSDSNSDDAEVPKRIAPADLQAANFRKMIMAMTKDIRVIVLKLADRLHNMRTLGHKSGPSQRRIARETLDIYVPIASRLAINKLAMELQDLCFKALYPCREALISAYTEKQTRKRHELLKRIANTARERLASMDINAEVTNRTKRSYSIYLKIKEKIRRHELPTNPAEEHIIDFIKDIFGLRIIVDDVDSCYRALGIMHNLYKPRPGQFKDYIAIPKRNGYQALHTVVMIHTPEVPMEVQIRSRDMDGYAQHGIATHGLYKAKESESSSQRRRATEWLRDLQEIQQNSSSHRDFLESVTDDLFPDEIYVFTPGGEVIELKRHSTAVDFAYAIHSDLGNKMIAAKVDDVFLEDLSVQLRTGQTIDIRTANWARPKLFWLDFVATKKARTGIRNFFKHLQREEAINMGRRMLDRELEPHGMTVADLTEVQRSYLLTTFNLADFDTLLEDIGRSKRMALTVSRHLLPTQEHDTETKGLAEENPTLIVKGTDGFLVTLGKCCHPIPGDVIKGYVTTGSGIVVHTTQCKNTQSQKYKAENWIDLSWADQLDNEFAVDIRLDVKNQPGVLGTIANTMASIGINIDGIYSEAKGDSENTLLRFAIKVRDRKHLAEIEQRLRRLAIVRRVYRVK